MPISVSHVLTATGSDNTKYEIRPSHWNSGHAIVLNLSGTDISNAFSNSNNVSFGTNVFGAMTASASQSVQTQGSVLIQGSSGAIVFANSNGVTFGGNNGTITASAAGGGGGVALSAAGSSQNTGTVIFSNSNGLAFGMNGATITGSYTVPSQTAYVFSSSNGISFGTNGSTVTASYTVPTQSVQTQASGAIAGTNWTTTSTAGSQLTGTMNSSGLTLAVPSWLTAAAGGGVNIAASNTTFTSGTVVISNNGGALTISSGAQSVLFSVPATSSISGTGLVSVATAGSTISIGVPALSVSAGAGTSNTLSGITFQNSNGITFGLSTGAGVGSMTASYNSTQFAGQGTTITGNASITLGSAGMSFNGSGLAGTATAITGNALITLNSTGMSFNGTSLAGTATAITGNALITLNSSGMSFNGTSLMGTGTSVTGRATINLNSAGMSFNGSALVGSATTTASTTGAFAFGANSSSINITIPYLTRCLYPDGNQMTALNAPGNASMSFQYINPQIPITATRLDALLAMSHSSSAGAGTVTYNFSQYAVIYTRNASSLSSLSSGSTQTTYTYASNTAGATYLSQSAIYPISVPVNVNMAPGEYIVGFNVITANTAGSATMSVMGGSWLQTAVNYAEFAATATSVNLRQGMGVYSVASTGMPTALSLSAVNQTGSAAGAANIALVFRNA